MLTEGMLSVYKQAEGIKPEDEEAFAFYALITMGGIHHHHVTEEEKYCALVPALSLTHIVLTTQRLNTVPGLEPEFVSTPS
jgi:hypothetical protein